MSAKNSEGRTPPEGFTPLKSKSPFVNRIGTFYVRKGADGSRTVGAFVDEARVNSESYAHGGFLLAFADFALSIVTNGITVNITADFLRPARLGDWIEARINIRKSSAALVFADAILVSGEHELVRVGGLFRPFEKKS
ncbi:PaaI family thioesterase [Sphingosinicella sp. LHD-64]|uniref:PaaI family thioesterase n=1 Tax=Sphingosinicella sp. LHD-64 TaxID=3072139 RepID=UPI00280F8601|nr:PaaI family thioesterase [Sphingosinicella sp. LHD-64]MDQ8757596.1 PaaI family thioesterase [Sphingosinicella sp. LHD-64]